MKKTLLLLVLFLSTSAIIFAQNPLVASYYNGTNFDDFVGTNTVSNIDFYWHREAPIQGVDPQYCSVRYEGQLKSPATGDVTFTIRGDDGFRLWLDDELVILNWQLNDVGFSEGVVHMTANKNYKLKVEFFNALHEAELRLLWTLPKDPDANWLSNWWYEDDPTIIPSEFFDVPIEEELVVVPIAITALEPDPEPTPKPKPKSVSKPKPKVQPTVPKEVPVVYTPVKVVEAPFQKYIPQSVEFEQAKSEILSVSFAELDELASFLVKHPTRKLKIEGHTDNVGDANQNQLLSQKRALAVAGYLVKKGVNNKQITSAEGYGGSQPLVKDDGREYHPENRRVEFIIE